MEKWQYPMIFKRKSFHTFSGAECLSKEEIQNIQCCIQNLQPLCGDIRTEFRIVPRNETKCRPGEYCIVIYSEIKEYYLQNAGYMGEQLDLWLASQNIGACWYGMGKPAEEKRNGLDYVIMIAIEKTKEANFRKDLAKVKRKKAEEIWEGDFLHETAASVRYAPSACNSQPWLVRASEKELRLYQIKGKRGIMPMAKVEDYNRIDIGIFMLILEVCLEKEGVAYDREICRGDAEKKERLTAVYKLTERNGQTNGF